jgi:SPW repeat
MSCEWLSLAGGLWLVVSPFVLGFEASNVAAVNAVVVGAFVALLSAWALELDRGLGRLWNRLIAH